MKNIQSGLVALSLLVVASAGSAQVRCERGVPAVDLGVTYAAAMSEEPRIEAVDAKGPAAGRLQKGDYVSRVNGFSFATPQAIAAMRETSPGKAMVLTVRRGERLVPVTVTPTRVHCSTLVALQPTRVPLMAPSRAAAGGAGRAATSAEPTLTTGRVYPSSGWLGMGFACSECDQRITTAGRAWVFSEPPTIYNVDTGSPAYAAGIRRGDVLLRVEGNDVRTAVAGARLAQVQPGEALRLTYRRGSRTSDATVRVARSPVAARATEVAGTLHRSTQELRLSQMEVELRRLHVELDQNAATQRALAQQLERTLAGTDTQAARSARVTLERLQQEQVEAQRMVRSALRAGEETVVAGSLRPFEAGQAALTMERTVAGSPIDTVIQIPRADRLRYSGSVGDSDVEVRGPGSVNVQRIGDDLFVITADAIVKVTQRKARSGN